MADKQIIKDAHVFVGGRELTTLLNQISLSIEINTLEGQTFTSDTVENCSGLMNTTGTINGFSDADQESDPESPELFNRVGQVKFPISISPNTPNAGNRVFIFEAPQFSYNPGASIGELFAFEATFQGASRPINAVVGKNSISSAESTSGTADGQELGEVTADQKLYAILHVIESNGDGSQTLDVEIESDEDNNFASPVSRLSFDQVTTSVNGEFKTVDGAISDTFFRVKYTIGGSGSPSYKFLIGFGIL